MKSRLHTARTLWLCGALHAFVHIYHVALLPLYLPIQRDLKLASVEESTLLVTAMMFAYILASYASGILADRCNRKRLLTLGLAFNGLGFLGLAFAPSYALALGCVIVAGLGGSFYHPAATALIARLFPTATGRALGLTGIGASVGFFASPLYVGWRAETAGWRAPVFELGVLGILMAFLFGWLADEEPPRAEHGRRPEKAESFLPASSLWLLFVASGLIFGLRDFTGGSMGSLGSLFLQKAHGYSLKETGFALSGIFLASALSNPLFGHLSDRARLRWTALVLIAAAATVALFPRLPSRWLVVGLGVYGFFFMASYPMVEAELMQSVSDRVRGRMFGLFITLSGLVGNLAHWMSGRWVKALGQNAHEVSSYYPLYGLLAGFILLSLLGLPCLHLLRRQGELGLGRRAAPVGLGRPQLE
jgi:FSR family fosmidomycin resistance protein-like MFS transporter